MAQQDDSVLGTEKTTSKGFLDTVGNVLGNIGEAAGDAFEVAKDIGSNVLDIGKKVGGEILETTGEMIDVVGKTEVGKFFGVGKPTPTDLKASETISQELIDTAKELKPNTTWDVIKDIGKLFSSQYTLRTDESIKDLAAFTSIQELNKTFADSLKPMAYELEQLKKLVNKTQAQIDQKNYLETQIAELERDYTEKEESLISRAIKGTTIENKRAKMDIIYDKLHGTGEVSKEGELVLKRSEKADELLDKYSRDRQADNAFIDSKYMTSVNSLKKSLASELSTAGVQKELALAELINSGTNPVTINYIMGLYNEREELDEMMTKHTIDSAYNMVSGDDMSYVVAKLMGHKNVKRRTFLENEIIAILNKETGKANWDNGNKITGAIQTMNGLWAGFGSKIKQKVDEVTDTDDGDILASEASYLRSFDKTLIKKSMSWFIDNKDDLLLGIGGVALTAIATRGVGAGGLGILKMSSRTREALNKFDKFSKSSAFLRTLFKNKYIGVESVIENVGLGITANALIDTALNDPTSEGRIAMNVGMDVIGGPILDILVGGMVGGVTRTFKGGIDTYGGISKLKLVNSLKDQFGTTEEKAVELLDAWIDNQKLNQTKLVDDIDYRKYGKEILEKVRNSENGAISIDGVTSVIKKDSLSIVKQDRGLSDELITKVKNTTIDLKTPSLERLQVKRLFNEIELVNTSSENKFLANILGNLGIPKDDIEKNMVEVAGISSELYSLAVNNKNKIQSIKDIGVLDISSTEVLNDIGKFQKGIDQISALFNKDKEVLQFYTADGSFREYLISDIERNIDSGAVKLKSTNKQLFDNTSIFNSLKPENTGFEELSILSAKFIREGGGTTLTDSQLIEVIDGIQKITGVTPNVISKEDVVTDTSRIALYLDSETNQYKIYVGGKYLYDIKGIPNKIHIEQSGIKYKNAIKYSKDKIKQIDDKGNVTWVVNKFKKPLKEVSLSTEEIKYGDLNRAIWNRILLADKPFSPAEFDDFLAGESLHYNYLISTKSKILYNAVTLKDAQASKGVVVAKLRKILSPELDSVELEQFLSLMDETLFSIDSLNQLTRFSREIGQKLDKPAILGNLMMSLATYSAQRFKTLDLSETIIKDLLQKNINKVTAKKAVVDILLGKNAVGVLTNIGLDAGDNKKLLKSIEAITGLKINDPLLTHSESELTAFIERIVKLKNLNGNLNVEQVSGQEAQVRKVLKERMLKARDFYLSGAMSELYKGSHSINSILEGLHLVTTLGDDDAIRAVEFKDAIIGAKTIDEIVDISKVYKGIRIDEKIKSIVEKKKDELLMDLIPTENRITGELIDMFHKLETAFIDTQKISKIDGETNFEAEAFKLGDNIVTKSITHMLNPDNKSVIFEESLSKSFSDSLSEIIFGEKLTRGFHEISNDLRRPDITDADFDTFSLELKTLKEKLHNEIFPKDTSFIGTVFNLENFGIYKKRREAVDNKLEKLYNEIKGQIIKGNGKYKVFKNGNEKLSDSDIAELAFGPGAGFEDKEELLNIIRNNLARKPFNGYKYDLESGSFVKHKDLEEDRTIFGHLTDKEMSKGGLDFIPLIIENGKSLYKLTGSKDSARRRHQHAHANNIYKYLMDNAGVEPKPRDYNDKKAQLINLVSNNLSGTTLQKSPDLIGIGRHMGFTDDVYMLTLSLGDKNGVGIGFNIDNEFKEKVQQYYATKYNKPDYEVTLDELYNRAIIEFHNRFNAVYKFSGKDAAFKKITKRLGTLTHEEESLTPGVELKLLDLFTEELGTIETFLTRNRFPQKNASGKLEILRTFTEEEEEYIIKLLDKEKGISEKDKLKLTNPNTSKKEFDRIADLLIPVTFEEKQKLINIYSNSNAVEPSLLEMWDKTPEGAVDGMYKFLIGPKVTDGASHQSEAISNLLGVFNGVFKKDKKGRQKGAKYHVAHLGIDLTKTYFNPFDSTIKNSVDKLMGNGITLGDNKFTSDAVRVNGIESKKIGAGSLEKLPEGSEQYIEYADGTKRKILGYKVADTKYNRTAGKETFEEGEEVNGISKQVKSIMHSDALQFLSEVELVYIKKEISDIQRILGLDDSLPLPTGSDYALFLKTLVGKDVFSNLSMFEREYVKKRCKKMLDFLNKPKDDSFGYRAKIVPTPMYKSNGVMKYAKTNEVYVSKDRFNSIIKNSGTIKIKNAKGTDEYYVISYRNPVPNSQNITLQKLVIDENILIDGSIGISPLNVNASKQADSDGDSLNIVYIKGNKYKDGIVVGKTHEGGLSAALSFIFKHKNNNLEETNGIKSLIGSVDTLENKQNGIIEYIKSFLKQNPDFTIPLVNVAQVDEGISEIDLVKINDLSGFISNEVLIVKTINDLIINGGDQSLVDNLIGDLKLFKFNKTNKTFKYNSSSGEIKFKVIEKELFDFLFSGNVNKPNKEIKKLLLKYQSSKGETFDIIIKNLQKDNQLYKTTDSINNELRENIEDQFLEGYEAKQFLKANANTIISKDGIDLVSASNRTNLGLLEISYLWKNNLINDIELKQMLGLEDLHLSSVLPWKFKDVTSDDILQKFKDLFNGMSGTLDSIQEYDYVSSSIVQRTVDASKNGNLPANWDKTLRDAAFGNKEIPEEIIAYMEKMSIDHGKAFKFDGLGKYGTEYNPITKQKDKSLNKSVIFGRNVYIRNALRDFSSISDTALVSRKISTDAKLKMIDGTVILNKYDLLQIIENTISEDKKWLAELVVEGSTPFMLSKKTLVEETRYPYLIGKAPKSSNNTPYKALVPKQGLNPNWKKGSKVKKYIDYYDLPINMIGLSEQEIKKLGLIIKDVEKLPYRQNDFYINNNPIKKANAKKFNRNFYHYMPTHKDYKHNMNIAEGGGLQILLPKYPKDQDKIFNMLVEAIQEGRDDELLEGTKVITKELPNGAIFTKEEILKQLNGIKGRTRPEDFLNITLAQKVFNKEALQESTQEGHIAHSILNIEKLAKQIIDSGELDNEGLKKFESILEKFPTIKGESYKVNEIVGNTIVVQTPNVKVLDQDIQIGEGDTAQYFKIREIDGNVHITDMSGDVSLKDNLEIIAPTNLKDFQSTPATVEQDFMNRIGSSMKDIRDVGERLNKTMEELSSSAILVNSKIALRYFKEFRVRTSSLEGVLTAETHDMMNNITKKYNNTLPSGRRRELANMVYYVNNGKISNEVISGVTDSIEIDYLKEIESFYSEKLHKFVRSKQINIPYKYNKHGNIIEDLSGLSIGKTEKIPFVEKGIWTTEDFQKLTKTAMEAKGVKYSKRIAEDLFGGIFEKNILDTNKWYKSLKGIRNATYQVMLGSLTWLTTGAGFLIGLAQIPIEFLRTQAFTRSLKGFESGKINNLMSKYGILTNIGVETAIRVGPQEIDAPFIQKGIFNILDKFGSIIGVNKSSKYVWLTRRIAALGGNPLVITDLFMDSMRKQASVSDAIWKMGFDDVDTFIAHIKNLDEVSRETLLANIRLHSKEIYSDISGGVTSSSYLYRESYLSRRLVPFNFLMGWSNRIGASVAEDVGLLYKGLRKVAGGNYTEGFDLMFNQSKAIEKLVTSNILIIALYSKMQIHDKYDGEFDTKRNLVEWIQGMNSNFIALGMSFPIKIFKAGIEGDEGFEVRLANMLKQVVQDTFRELDLGEILAENSVDWLNGERDMTDVVISTITAKASKGLMYNKVLAVESIYPEFRERDEVSRLLLIDMKSEEEEVFFDIYNENDDAVYKSLIDSGNHVGLLREAIKALPFLSIYLRDKDFNSFEVYNRQINKAISTLNSDKFNELMKDPEALLETIDDTGNIGNLYNALQSPIKASELDYVTGEAILSGKLDMLTEDLTVKQIIDKYGSAYPEIVQGIKDGGIAYILRGGTKEEEVANQLMLKIVGDYPSSIPYIIGEILKQREYDWEQEIKEQRGYDGTINHIEEYERDAKQREIIKDIMPLIKGDATSLSKVAGYALISQHPELIDTVMDNDNIKSNVLRRMAIELAVSKARGNGELNPTLMASRMSIITNKQDKLLADGKITEQAHKESLLDTFNFGLDRINNSNMSIDEKVEMKTAMLVSLGEYGHILEEDPLLSNGFEGARVNLMHKLFSTLTDLRPYAEEAALSLARSTGQINEGQSGMLSGNMGYSRSRAGNQPFPGANMGPALRNTLARPGNGFAKAYTPGRSGFNVMSGVRPLVLSKARSMGVEEFRKFLVAVNSKGLIQTTKKYQKMQEYIRVGRAESIFVEPRPYLPPVHVKRSTGLIYDMPYKR